MRLQDKRSFKALNFDDADEYLADGDMRDALNIRVGYSESGDDGIIENVKGNISIFSQLDFNLPSGMNKCIGTCADDQNNRLIWFNWNQYNNHGIYCYNDDSSSIQTVLESSTLNFDGSIIHSIDILNNIIAWVDNNRPRSINVTHGIAGLYNGAPIEELINDAKIVPMVPIVCTPSITKSQAYIQTLRSFQFIYRYVFVDGEKGAWSSVSKLVPTAYKDEHIDKITLDVSSCEIFTKIAIRPIISYIEFASRELYTFAFNQFLRISTADLITAGGIIEYFDTESKTALDPTTDTDIPFFEVPIKAGTVAFQNDRKFYADCTEGYDAAPLSTSNVYTEIIPQEGGIPYLSDCDTHANERYLKPDSKYNYSVQWVDKYGRKSGAIDLPQLTIQTAPQISNDYKANVLNFDIDLTSQAPAWAEKIEILRSDNQSVTFFVQGRVNNILYCKGYDGNGDPIYIKPDGTNLPGVGVLNISDSGAAELHVDISNWIQYNTNIGYTFTEGDRITFFTMGGTGTTDVAANSTLRGLKIKGMRGSLLVVEYPLIGRTTLNDVVATDYTSFDGSFVYKLTRFIVGDNGLFMVSDYGAHGSPGFVNTDFNNLVKINLSISNNLNSISTIYDNSGISPVIGIFIAGDDGFFGKGVYFNPFIPNTGYTWSFAQLSTGIADNINCVLDQNNNNQPSDMPYLIMVGDNGKILRYNTSTDAITQDTSGVTTNLNHVAVSEYISSVPANYIAIGDGGVILMSVALNTVWELVELDIDVCQNLNCVYFDMNGNGCIVGDEGLVLISNDMGFHWTRLDVSTKVNLNSASGVGVTTTGDVYIAGDDGYVARINILASPHNIPHVVDAYSKITTKNIRSLRGFDTDAYNNRGALVGDYDLLIDADFLNPTTQQTDYSSSVQTIFGGIYLNYKAKVEIYSPKTAAGPTIYYEVGDAFPVGQSYSLHKGKGDDGDVFLIRKDFQGNTSTNADSSKSWSATGEFIFSITPDSNNTAGTWDKDFGRPNVVLLYPEVQQRRNIIRYSDRYVQDSKVNGLSSFQEFNYELIQNEFGWIRKIVPIETIMLVIAERESATAYIDQSVFFGTNGQATFGLSGKVINNVRRLAGGFGCTNPESIATYSSICYWYSSNKKAVCRYNISNGIFPISEYKARSYFFNFDLSNYSVIGGFEPRFKNYLLSTIPNKHRELIINPDFSLLDSGNIKGWFSDSALTPILPNPGSNPPSYLLINPQIVIYSDHIMEIGKTYTINFDFLGSFPTDVGVRIKTAGGTKSSFIGVGSKTVTFISDGSYFYFELYSFETEITNVSCYESILIPTITETIAFQEPTNRWISKYSFIPEKYGHVKIDMFSFKDGELWKHDSNEIRNNFYGQGSVSRVNPVFNREPSAQKNFLSLSLESPKVWSAISMKTPEGQESVLSGNHFEQINKEWWADIKQDLNTPNMSGTEALFNGDYMQSNVLNVIMESTLSDPTKLRFANLYSNINERTNR